MAEVGAAYSYAGHGGPTAWDDYLAAPEQATPVITPDRAEKAVEEATDFVRRLREIAQTPAENREGA